jgi:hypothetical protein
VRVVRRPARGPIAHRIIGVRVCVAARAAAHVADELVQRIIRPRDPIPVRLGQHGWVADGVIRVVEGLQHRAVRLPMCDLRGPPDRVIHLRRVRTRRIRKRRDPPHRIIHPRRPLAQRIDRPDHPPGRVVHRRRAVPQRVHRRQPLPRCIVDRGRPVAERVQGLDRPPGRVIREGRHLTHRVLHRPAATRRVVREARAVPEGIDRRAHPCRSCLPCATASITTPVADSATSGPGPPFQPEAPGREGAPRSVPWRRRG